MKSDNFMNKNIFNSHIQEIHTFDAYYKNVILRNNHLVIPYINLGVSHHPLNQLDNLLFLDFSYMVFQNISYLDVYLNNKRYKVVDRLKSSELYHMGGIYKDYGDSIFNDMAISCEAAFLQTLEMTKLSKEMWIPEDTPYFKPNMENQLIVDFFNNRYLPENIGELIG